MRKRKGFFLVLSSFLLSSCSFSYQKAITLDSALRMLSGEEGAIANFSLATSNRATYGIGLSKEFKGEKEDPSYLFKEKEFCIYSPATNGFSFDYYLENAATKEYRNVLKRDDGLFVSESFEGEYRVYEEEKDGDLNRFFDFPNSYFRFYMEKSLLIADTFLRSILDPEKGNSLTSFCALSSGNGNLVLSFEGEDLALSFFDPLAKVEPISYNAFSLDIKEKVLSSVSFAFTYQDEDESKGLATFVLDFELS